VSASMGVWEFFYLMHSSNAQIFDLPVMGELLLRTCASVDPPHCFLLAAHFLSWSELLLYSVLIVLDAHFSESGTARGREELWKLRG